MPRKKRVHPMLDRARIVLYEHAPELSTVPLRLHMLDGPPGSPRYSVAAEMCCAHVCEYGVTPEVSEAGECPVLACDQRRSIRLLLDREGNLVEVVHSGIHWK